MKKQKLISALGMLSILTLSLFAMSFALAEDIEDTEEPMLISENPLVQEVDESLEEDVNGWAIARKRMSLWFTFGEEKKAEKELDLARMRLIQARVAARNNNTVAMEKALEAHNRLLEKVQNRVKNLESANSSEDTQKLVGLDRAIQVHEMRLERTQQMLDNSNLTDSQKQRVEQAMNQTQLSIQNLQQVQANQMERTRTRLMALANMSEEEAEQTIQSIQNATSLDEVKQIAQDLKAQKGKAE